MISGNSKWVRAVLTTAVILAITVITVPAMAQNIFYSIPTYNASGYVVTLWSSTTVGKPFAPVEVYLGGTYLTTVSLNSTGGLYAQIMLPYGLKAGNYTFSLNTTSTTISMPFELKFSISPGFASPGQSLTLNVTGWGFAGNETVNIYLINSVTGATTLINSTTANPWGFVNVTFLLPAQMLSSVGEYFIEAVGQTSGVTYLAPFYVTKASVSPKYLAVYNGYNYTLFGGNYPSGTYVDVCFNGIVVNSFKLGMVTTNFTTTIPILYHLPLGNYSVVAIATPGPVPIGAACPGVNETYEGGYATATWTVVPQIVLSTISTCTESTVDIYGYGFPAYPTIQAVNVSVYYNGQPVENITAPINSTGEFELSFTPTKYGTYTFVVTNFTYTYNGTTYPKPVNLTVPPPTISISPSKQIVGGFVTISGVCFPPNETVQVYMNSVSITDLAIHFTPTGAGIGGISTNSTGGFSSLYIVPLLPPGTYKVSVNVSGVPSSNTVNLTIPAPSITLNTTSIYEGGPIGFTGHNFANFTLGYSMTINLNGYYATCQINNTLVLFGPSDTGALYCTMFSNGTVTGYIIMPVVKPGTYTVYFNSTYFNSTLMRWIGATFGTNDTLYTMASVPMKASYIVVTPSPAPAGAPISVTGYNFYPDTTVNIYVYYNGTLVAGPIPAQVWPNGVFKAPNVYFVPSYMQAGVLYIVAKESSSTYIAGTPPNAVGNATATVNITNVHVVIINLLNEVLGSLANMNATLTTVYNAVQSMSSELSTVYKAVLNMSSTLQFMSSTLSSIESTLSSMQSTLSSMQSTLSTISSIISALPGQVSTIISDLSSMKATLMNIYDVVSTLNLTVIQNELSTINSNVLSVNSTLTTYAGTIQGELGSIESTLVSMNKTLTSKVSTVPSVVSGGSGSYTFTSPGAYTIYQGSGVAQITVTLYYTGYTTAYIYVYPIPGDTTHVVKLQVTSSAGYTVTVSGWRVDIYVTSAWPYSPVTVYYSYTAIS
jgi:archaellum component FlaC